MDISSFDDLLCAARRQPEPQRLLFVFAEAALPEDATAQERAAFDAGAGGTLTPLMSVDKAPETLESFTALVDESREFGRDWTVVFAAGLSGHGGLAPTLAAVDRSLQHMIESIKTGEFGAYIPFDRQGHPIQIG